MALAGAVVQPLVAWSTCLDPIAAQQPGRGSRDDPAAIGGRTPGMGSPHRRPATIRRPAPSHAPRRPRYSPGALHERYDQFHRGVRVFGADVAEQLNRGQLVSAFGNVYEGIDVDTTPSIDADRARESSRIARASRSADTPELVILPRDEDGQLAFAWRGASAPPPEQTSASTSSTRATADRLRLQRPPDAGERGRSRSGRSRRHEENQRLAERRAVRDDRSVAPAGDQYLRHAGRLSAHHRLPQRSHPADDERFRLRLRQHLDRRRQRRRAHLRRLDLRLLLQALRPPRPRQSRPADHQPRAPGAPAGLFNAVNRPDDFYLNAVYAATGSWSTARACRPDSRSAARSVDFISRRARHRRPRADARRHAITRRG